MSLKNYLWSNILSGLTNLALSTFSVTVSSGSAVSLTNNTPKTIMSMVLQPGTYLVEGMINYQMTTATMTVANSTLLVGISDVNNTHLSQAGDAVVGTDPNSSWCASFPASVSGVQHLQCGHTIVTVVATTTIYLVALAQFSAGTVTAYGSMFATQADLP